MSRRLLVESAKSNVRVAVARALATALITGIDNAAEEGRPLTQLQQTDLATMSVMAYQEALDSCGLLDFEAFITPSRSRKDTHE